MLLELKPPVYLPWYDQNLSHADVVDICDIVRRRNRRDGCAVSNRNHRQIFTGLNGMSPGLRGYGTASATGIPSIFAGDRHRNRDR